MKIKAVIFDYGGVIVKESGPFKREISEKLKVEHEEFRKTLRVWFNKWKIGEITEDELWTNTLSELNAKCDVGWLKDEIRRQHIDGPLMDFVKELRQKNIKTAILSNTGKEWFSDQRKKFELDKYFDTIVISCDEKIAKPNPEFYGIAVQKLGVKAEECIFVDDGKHNVDAAISIGMKGILYRSAEQLRKEIEND